MTSRMRTAWTSTRGPWSTWSAGLTQLRASVDYSVDLRKVR